MDFPAAPLDRSTRVVTAGVFAVVVFVMSFGVRSSGGLVSVAVVALPTLLLLVLGWGMAPAGYRLADGHLEVRRWLFPPRRLELTGEVVRAPARFGLGGIRLLGSGGFFGWYGTYWRQGSGRYLAYLTDRSRIVACGTANGLVLISPADPEAFIAAARKGRR